MGCDKPSNMFFVPLGFRQLDGWKIFLRSPGLGNMCVVYVKVWEPGTGLLKSGHYHNYHGLHGRVLACP